MNSIELRDLVVAWLGLAFAFAVALGGFSAIDLAGKGFNLAGFAFALIVSLIVVGTAFVFHELMHRFTARHFNYHAEFRLWPLGLIFAVALSLLLGVVFAAPGAVYIGERKFKGRKVTHEESRQEFYEFEDFSEQKAWNELGLISVAGPLTNIVLGFVFLGGALVFAQNSILFTISAMGFSINMFLALFNLIPFGPLDGAKVFVWNKAVWAILFIPLLLWFFVFSGF
ncbi:MAG: site-2 protease family protein [Candidatus Diapherotrites archaeon]